MEAEYLYHFLPLCQMWFLNSIPDFNLSFLTYPDIESDNRKHLFKVQICNDE